MPIKYCFFVCEYFRFKCFFLDTENWGDLFFKYKISLCYTLNEKQHENHKNGENTKNDYKTTKLPFFCKYCVIDPRVGL
jgi:hypothetical protein